MKLLLAKTIYWGGIVLLVLLLIGLVITIGVALSQMIPAEVWIIFGLFAAAMVVLAGLNKIWSWAENYLEKNK